GAFKPKIEGYFAVSRVPWPLALILLLVQTGSEELLFRGYLMQALAARFRSGWIWFVIPSLLFGAAHFNPEIDPRLNYAFLFAVTLFGFLAADLTRVTGNLGAAMGFHFANNFFALFLVSIEGEMSGLSLYHAAFTMEDVDTILPLVAIDVVTVLGVWWWLRRWLDPNRV
ncbi:MAG: CPBP family intramembrane metalloprotease, partial [Litoreibacter sp.]|nr:CPBP family intramembrane metalloprotease [Litoreibacter sp.]